MQNHDIYLKNLKHIYIVLLFFNHHHEPCRTAFLPSTNLSDAISTMLMDLNSLDQIIKSEPPATHTYEHSLL